MTQSIRLVTTIFAAAFTGETSRHHDVMVDANGTVRVWDSIGGIYTALHNLTNAEEERARRRCARATILKPAGC